MKERYNYKGEEVLKFNLLTIRIFTVFEHSLLEDRVLHKEAWVVKLLGTHLSIQVHKKVEFSRRDISSLAVKGLSNLRFIPRDFLNESFFNATKKIKIVFYL